MAAFWKKVGCLQLTVSAARRGVLFFPLLLCACTATSLTPYPVSRLEPLQLEDRTISPGQAETMAPTPDLLAVDEEMRAFVERYTGDVSRERQRLMMLHRAVKGGGVLDMQYDPFAEGSARETFHRGAANCLSYASLFVALAREAGLKANYQWLEIHPEWSRMGDRVAVRLHVNVTVRLRNGEQFMVDIDPVPSRDVARTRELSDEEARALYHNNLAMDALAHADLAQAWANGVQALRLSPDMPYLWVNLGAIYRLAGQHRAAELSYLQALELDPGDHSAMNNLAVLYGIQGREEERQYWADRVDAYREGNPYYHAWRGDRAGELGNWREALHHYERAVRLLPEDSQLLYAKGLIHYELDELKEASRNISRAIENATRRTDIETYQKRLEDVRQAQVAGV